MLKKQKLSWRLPSKFGNLMIIDQIKSLFKNIIIIIFLNIFYFEMYQNNIIFIFKKLFLILTDLNNLKILKNI